MNNPSSSPETTEVSPELQRLQNMIDMEVFMQSAASSDEQVNSWNRGNYGCDTYAPSWVTRKNSAADRINDEEKERPLIMDGITRTVVDLIEKHRKILRTPGAVTALAEKSGVSSSKITFESMGLIDQLLVDYVYSADREGDPRTDDVAA